MRLKIFWRVSIVLSYPNQAFFCYPYAQISFPEQKSPHMAPIPPSSHLAPQYP